MSDERLEVRLARLEEERLDADRAYNEALTALDRAVASLPPDFPHPPPAYDAAKIAAINQAWDILSAAAPAADRSFKGRLRGLIWRVVAPAFGAQQSFNAALVDHLNRNVASHVETQKAIDSTIALLRQYVESSVQFQARLIGYLQTLTLYVDTKDRASAGGIDVLNAGLSAITDDWLKRWESLAVREARLNARAATVDDLRASIALAQQTSLAVKRELETLLTRGLPPAASGAGEPGSPPVGPGAPDFDAFKYVGFEDAFRGAPEEIARRLATYVPRFAGLTDVVDLGCGRGEFLSLLKAAGIPARGVDTNAAMVEASRGRGLDVSVGDALGFLQRQPDASLGGVFAAQVVEHLPPDYLGRVIETAAFKVRPGGLIVLETINPACWLAFFESYIRDLTHVRPIHPETLQYLVRVSGFSDVTIEYLSPVPESAKLDTLALHAEDGALREIVETLNDHAAKINARLFTFQDYAVTGHR